MGQQTWNKLFEQDYLPHLVERDNTVDPITGLSKIQSETAEEWVQFAIHDNKRKSPLDPLQHSHSFRPEEQDEGRKDLRHLPSLQHVSSSSSSTPEQSTFLRVPSLKDSRAYISYHTNVKDSNIEIKEKARRKEGAKIRDKNARYSNVTQNPDHLVILHPNMKLGVKHGDSSRMKFPVKEFAESDLRLKKIKNGYSMIKPEDASDNKEELFPILYIKRNMALGILPESPTNKKPTTKGKSESEIQFTAQQKRNEDSNVEARLEGELRDEFLTMMVTKMSSLDEMLQQRREKREEAYKSKEVLLKAADTIQKSREQGDIRSDGLWEKVKADANNDPTLLVTRVSLYMQIVQYVEKQGGLRTESEEEIVSLIREALQGGQPADKSLVSRVIEELGVSIVNDINLQEMMQYVGELVGLSHSELLQMLEVYQRGALMKNNRPYAFTLANEDYDEGTSEITSIDSFHGSTRLASMKRTTSYFSYPKILINTDKPSTSSSMTRVKSLDTANAAMPPLPRLGSERPYNEDSARDSDMSLPAVKSYTKSKLLRA